MATNIGEESFTNRTLLENVETMNKLIFLGSYKQQTITDGLKVCNHILETLGIIKGPASTSVSKKATALGEKLAERIIEELFLSNEIKSENDSDVENPQTSLPDSSPEEVSAHSNSASIYRTTIPKRESESDEEYQPEDEEIKINCVPFNTKIKILNMAKEHPNWSLKTIQKHGGSALRHKRYLKRWQKEIDMDGTRKKFDTINKWTFDRFREARQQLQPVTTKMIQQWASQAAMQHEGSNFHFKASYSWVKKFKQDYCIHKKKMTRCIESQNTLDLHEATLKEAEELQKQIANKILKFHLDFIINIGQTSCEYCFDIKRTLVARKEKATEAYLDNFNKVYNYTAQYSITVSGNLLPKVFLCLQEPKGESCDPTNIQDLMKSYGNVFITTSNSGKLTKDHFDSFIKHGLKDYCKDQEFLIILNSRESQLDSTYFNSAFTDNNGKCNCTIEIIPPHCAPYCQPCEAYFFNQVKDFIKRFQNSAEVLQNKRELSSREDAIKIHSLIHHQLSAPIFRKMIRHAWFVSKLISVRKAFTNINKACFPNDIQKHKCNKCKEYTFIRCAICKKYLCFACFYDLYHPAHCNNSFRIV